MADAALVEVEDDEGGDRRVAGRAQRQGGAREQRLAGDQGAVFGSGRSGRKGSGTRVATSAPSSGIVPAKIQTAL